MIRLLSTIIDEMHISVIWDKAGRAKLGEAATITCSIYMAAHRTKFFKIGRGLATREVAETLLADAMPRVHQYTRMLAALRLVREPMTAYRLSKATGSERKQQEPRDKSKRSFCRWAYRRCLGDSAIADTTRRQRLQAISMLARSGIVQCNADLTPANIRRFDDFLHAYGDRRDTTIKGYHKRIRVYVRQAVELGLVDSDPYARVRIKCGKARERIALTRDELQRIIDYNGKGEMQRARDMFVFCSHSGLAHCDALAIDASMIRDINGVRFIDAQRAKTGERYLAPILPPAESVLSKYGGRCPRIHNGRYNVCLHALAAAVGIRDITSHVARHTFATLALADGMPIEHLRIILGHSSIKTTQIYAHINDAIIADGVRRHCSFSGYFAKYT